MINYSRPTRSARPAFADTLPRLSDGRISMSHPKRPEIGTIVLAPGQSVSLNSQGGRTIIDADGTRRTVFARKQ